VLSKPDVVKVTETSDASVETGLIVAEGDVELGEGEALEVGDALAVEVGFGEGVEVAEGEVTLFVVFDN
jgi:hypothetical protein